MKLKVWLDSGANINSTYEVETTTEELGFTDEEWNALSHDEKEAEAKEVAFERSEWGWREISVN